MTSDNLEIGTAGFFMVGYTGENVESVEKTFALVLSLPLDEACSPYRSAFPVHPFITRVANLRKGEDWEF